VDLVQAQHHNGGGEVNTHQAKLTRTFIKVTTDAYEALNASAIKFEPEGAEMIEHFGNAAGAARRLLARYESERRPPS
jgi:hypothetical protein